MSRYDGLTTGQARFAADISPTEAGTGARGDVAGGSHNVAAVLHFVRSPYAHARITAIDTARAREMPGVLGVFRAADLDLEPIWEIAIIPEDFAQPPLARDVVRYVGERVVAVVAVDLARAVDAAEAVIVDYEPLDALAGPTAALAADAPALHAAHPGNVALDWRRDAPPRVGRADDVVVEGSFTMPRVSVSPMEGLAILAVPADPVDASDGPPGLVMYVSTQCPGAVRIQTARSLRIPIEQIRVIAPRVGGGFGGKSLGGVADYCVTAAVARRLRQPVRFVEDRTANLTTMHGRGVTLHYRLVAGPDGAIRSLAVQEVCDAGAYASTNAVEPGKTDLMACGPYRIDHVSFEARSAVCNLAPNGAYRGPGRSEATMVLEQALDALAPRVGLDPVEVRRRNLLRVDEQPVISASGARVADCDFHGLLEEVVVLGRYEEWRAEQRARAGSGGHRRLGIGIATAIDSSAWFARDEEAIAELDADGFVVHLATASAGQEHPGVFAACAAEVLGVAASAVRVVEGDTLRIAGYGSSGSRSAQLAGAASTLAAAGLRDAVRGAAAEVLEASPDDIGFDATNAYVRGVPARAITLVSLVERHGPFRARHRFQQEHATYPSAAVCAVVEVDTETGAVRPIAISAVADIGTVLDPPGAHGQVVGALAQAVGQVLYEQAVFDDDAQPLANNLATYALPGPREMPHFTVRFRPTPATTNPLGAKGAGEIGMVAGPPAIYAAVLDALGPAAARPALPCTPRAVWEALRAAC